MLGFSYIIQLYCLAVTLSTPAFAISNLTVMADEGASLAVARLARDYARESQVAVATSFLPKEQHANQILEGSSADVLITADTRWLSDLQLMGLVDIYSKQPFANGRLALIGPYDSALEMPLKKGGSTAPLIQAMAYEPALFIGNPEFVAEGKYAKQALRGLDMSDALEPYILYLKSMDDMVEQVTKHGGYSVVGNTRALLLDEAKIIGIFPEKSHQPIAYYAVVIASDNMDEARKFLKFLNSKPAKTTITSAGLSVAKPE